MSHALPTLSGAVVLINPESGVWPQESKVWPHLGLLYIGTVAKQEGYEVKLWDELIQGDILLEKIVKEGDIVGLSLVCTGIERGIEIARRAKDLGARYVVAGNDAAIFRARQLLSLSDAPIDAVFMSNSLKSVRQFFAEIPEAEIKRMQIPFFATSPRRTPSLSNEGNRIGESKKFTPEDFFLIPDLNLYESEYWEKVWSNYRSQWGHKHPNPRSVRNANLLLAQGCGRAVEEICEHCSIAGVDVVSFPDDEYIERTLETYKSFGIDTFFSVTDSAYELTPHIRQLKAVEPVDSLVMYGRAEAIADKPKRLEELLGVVKHRLLINCGLESADERVLTLGINKSNKKGLRVAENYQAIRVIRDAGEKAHLHGSLIFGSVGETKDSCERNLEFANWIIDTLKPGQFDVLESDNFWLNFGAPSSVVFRSYKEASKRAALAGKAISLEEWERSFGRFADDLVVPQSCEENWYHFFTNINYETACEYNAQVKKMMERVPGAVSGREYNFKPKPT